MLWLNFNLVSEILLSYAIASVTLAKCFLSWDLVRSLRDRGNSDGHRLGSPSLGFCFS